MPDKIVKRGYARLGLMGNPGDALGGAAVTCTISELWAQVTLTADTEIRFIEPAIEIPRWDSIDTFREYLVQRGHNGGRRLMSAIFSRFIKYCHSRNLPLSNQTFALSWESQYSQSGRISRFQRVDYRDPALPDGILPNPNPPIRSSRNGSKDRDG